MSGASFHVVDTEAKHGPTTYHDDPKLQAYAYTARVQSMGYTTTLTCHEDGAYTVEAAGLMPMTFASGKSG